MVGPVILYLGVGGAEPWECLLAVEVVSEPAEAEGGDAAAYSKSEIVQQVDDTLMQLGQDESTAIAENGH